MSSVKIAKIILNSNKSDTEDRWVDLTWEKHEGYVVRTCRQSNLSATPLLEPDVDTKRSYHSENAAFKAMMRIVRKDRTECLREQLHRASGDR